MGRSVCSDLTCLLTRFLVMRLKGGIQSFYVPFLLCLIVVFVRIKMVHVAVQMLAKDKQVGSPSGPGHCAGSSDLGHCAGSNDPGHCAGSGGADVGITAS